ncbi:MAG TPA: hypothetical protein VIF32_03535, partial [Gemmatimonadaceae bacterium]
GIAIIHDPFALLYVQRGELVHVLPDWSTPPVIASAVFPGRRLRPAHARAFVDALVAKFAGQECQALEQETRQIKARSRKKSQVSSPAA